MVPDHWSVYFFVILGHLVIIHPWRARFLVSRPKTFCCLKIRCFLQNLSPVQFCPKNFSLQKRVRISSIFSVLRPFSYLRPFLYFDLSTSSALVRLVYFELCTSTFCQIWTSYWSRSTGRSKVLVEIKFGQKGQSKV